MAGRSAFVYSPEYLAYKLSEEHPLNPIRLALTESLIEACGLLDGPDVFRATPRMATDDEIMYAHDREYVERVRDLGHAPRYANPTARLRPRTGDNPVFPEMHEASALVDGRLAGGRRAGDERAGGPRLQPGRRPAPRQPPAGVRLLRLQRLRGGDCLAADAGRARPLHRHRRPPRRRRPGDLLRGPRRPDDLVPRDRALPVPRHRRTSPSAAAGPAWATPSTCRSSRTPITPRSWSATTWSCRRWRGRSSRTSSWRRTAATATPSTR